MNELHFTRNATSIGDYKGQDRSDRQISNGKGLFLVRHSALGPFSVGSTVRAAPTDIAQFVRLQQCHRFLRLRLAERAHGQGFLRDFAVSLQDPPPLMMSGGIDFETLVFEQISRNKSSRDLREGASSKRDDGDQVVQNARGLLPGDEKILLQPRLTGSVSGWSITGDVDILRLARDSTGKLSALIVDVKSSETSKVEHRLQIAFYAHVLATLFASAGVDGVEIGLGVLYRGDGDRSPNRLVDDRTRAAFEVLGVETGQLEIVDEPGQYLDAATNLVLSDESVARGILEAEFENVPFHLTYRCDWCRYNPFCMKDAAETDDLSLIPYMTETDKCALQRAGVTTAAALSQLKSEGPAGSLIATSEMADLSAQLSVTWPVGARLDELIYRARRYRGWKGDVVNAPPYLPHRGYGTLPFCSPDHNPNLVRIFIDAQHDNQNNRIYMIGSLVTASEQGEVRPDRRKLIVHSVDRPPDTELAERELLLNWIDETMRAVVDLASPDESGKKQAPLHLIFFNRFDQDLFLDALARHAESILTATPMFDFVTQLAAFDSPVSTFLVEEIRELRNYPMLSQSLQSVARFLRFDWSNPMPFTRLFHERLFDYTGKFGDGDPTSPGGSPWYTSRSRFNSQIPAEYAYAAWGALPDAIPGATDNFAPYRAVSADDLAAFQARRLEAMEHIAADFNGNRQTLKSSFSLPDLDQFDERAPNLAHALREFVAIERHVELSGWKNARLLPPERRALLGETLIAGYRGTDQSTGVAARMRECEIRRQLNESMRREFREANPDAKQVRLSKEQKEQSAWSIEGVTVRLEIDVTGLDCSLQQALELNGLNKGDSVVISPRLTVDERLPDGDQVPFTPSPKQLLYGTRGIIERIVAERDECGCTVRAFLEIELHHSNVGTLPGGFIFASMTRPFIEGGLYTIDPDPNDWSGFHAKKVTDGLGAGGGNALYERIANADSEDLQWPAEARAGQQRFLVGLTELAAAGLFHSFEPSKAEYIGQHGDAPILLVQGPPGTGKSFTTAFALLARLQGAMAADLDFRVMVSCHTHAAIDVLMRNVLAARTDLEMISSRHPEIFKRYFDARLLEIPLYRYRPTRTIPLGIVELRQKRDLNAGDPIAADTVTSHRWTILGATPGGVRGLIDERWKDQLFDHRLVDCVVLDEASQLALPTAIMATLALKVDGRLIVVGDHRQMPPIVKHDWMAERRRTFNDFQAFESLFNTLLNRTPRPPLIQFAQSFRLHRDMAEFLRREIYRHDGIDFRSSRDWRLVDLEQTEPFVRAALSAEHPLVVITHDERGSQLSNDFERDIILELSRALTDERIYGDELGDGFGVVVPHRAQRASMATAFLSFPDRVGNKPVIADTVERFQGDEREVIIVSATESDPSYLLAASGFLLDPRRLTVALSRAKRKMILVASRSVFELFSTDESTFANSQIWKDLLKRTCTVPLWSGERAGHQVEVWGNASIPD